MCHYSSMNTAYKGIANDIFMPCVNYFSVNTVYNGIASLNPLTVRSIHLILTVHVQQFTHSVQAVKLWWKNVSFLDHPRYMNPKYRDDAVQRDQELCCFHRIREAGNGPSHGGDRKSRNRWCVWRDAQWPWS